MANHHFEKWISKTVFGLFLITGGIFFMYYSITHFGKTDWVLYGLITSIACGVGGYLLSSAAINKVKSDLIKKQKIKQQSG